MTKAAIKICIREVEIRFSRMAYETISKHISAMSKCLEMASLKVDKSSENWTSFAPTLSDYNPMKYNHLDAINRVSFMQSWLTRMKNRGMNIETLTSGPGIVFTYKDLNECL